MYVLRLTARRRLLLRCIALDQDERLNDEPRIADTAVSTDRIGYVVQSNFSWRRNGRAVDNSNHPIELEDYNVTRQFGEGILPGMPPINLIA